MGVQVPHLPRETMNCGNCKYWREPFKTNDGFKGHCKKDPPQAIIIRGQEGETDDVVWTQPLTTADDYCFHYSEKG